MRRAVTAIAGLATLAAGLVTAGPVAAAAVPTSLSVIGHGYGHGRGMGQYGAYGYALGGWSYQSILAHYYGGTTLGGNDPSIASQPITVNLAELSSQNTVSMQGSGLTARWSGGQLAASSLSVTRSGSALAVNGVAASGDVTVTGSGDVAVSLSGGWRSYKGSIVVKASTAQTWNVLPLDEYVAGVVPAESIASWGVNGEAALEAQAVAARSYALARAAYSGGVICDTTACQVYDGDPDAAGNPTNSAYTTYTDRAVSTTSGQVLRDSAGSVVLAEFSASTGGWTAGGTFPAVVDSGDATSSNPYHTWTASIPVSWITSAWPSIGTFEAATVTARNGLGDLGGRVTQIVISGSAGHQTVSGDTFAAWMGLDSDWFAFTNTGQPSGGTDGYWVLGGNGSVLPFGAAPSYGSAANLALAAPVVGMAPTSDQGGYWIVAGDGGVFSYGDARFYGSTGGMRLNRPVIGMAPTPTSGGYWLYAGDGGVFTFGDAGFHGSTGGIRLNAPVVGMAATRSGDGYWLVAADGGVFTFGDARFYGSTGGKPLNQPVVGIVPTADGGGYWLVARDGGVFTFGDAGFVGSLPGLGITDTVTGVAPTADGGGYLVLGASGRAYPFGDAPYFGDPASTAGWNGTAVSIAGHRG